MSLTARLREIERKVDPATKPGRRPREIHESLQQVKAMLELLTQKLIWTLYTSEDGCSTLFCASKGVAITNNGIPFITLQLYNSGWPVVARMATPRPMTTGEQFAVCAVGDIFEYTNVIVRDSKELSKVLGDHLDTPAVLDWLKVQT